MLRIEDDMYGVLYLAPLCDGWYIEFENWSNYPNFYLVINKKIIDVTREMPNIVWDKIKNS